MAANPGAQAFGSSISGVDETSDESDTWGRRQMIEIAIVAGNCELQSPGNLDSFCMTAR